jgi:hypothetical protein
MSDKPSFSVSDLARRWSCKPDHVRSLIRSGRLVAIDVSLTEGSQRPTYRIMLEEVLSFEAVRSTRPTPKPPKRRKRSPDVIRFSERMKE